MNSGIVAMDCAAPTPICSVSHTCGAACANDADCAATTGVCDTVSGVCVECVTVDARNAKEGN